MAHRHIDPEQLIANNWQNIFQAVDGELAALIMPRTNMRERAEFWDGRMATTFIRFRTGYAYDIVAVKKFSARLTAQIFRENFLSTNPYPTGQENTVFRAYYEYFMARISCSSSGGRNSWHEFSRP